jgi:hypothetical protein
MVKSPSLIGLALGAAVDGRFFMLPGLVAGFLLQHAVQGWCPPVTFLRRGGFSTAAEIDQERCALKALRGDFRNVPHAHDGGSSEGVWRALQAVRT